jgi:hypothetical protein
MTVLFIVTAVSLVVALVMSIVAWRVTAEQRRRSTVRVAALANDIHETNEADLALRSFEPEPAPGDRFRERAVSSPPVADLFASTQPSPSGSRFATAIACGVIVVAGMATVGLLLGTPSHPTRGAAAAQTTPSGLPAPVPLELLALGHERAGEDLTVRGVVRNPPAGVAVEHLTAVVFLFNRDGSFLTSGRASVESPSLVPGGESRFVVSVPSAADVGRYRVSFRTDDRVVPHVDRREPALARR